MKTAKKVMTIGGVDYAEAHGTHGRGCTGCAFSDVECISICMVADEVFGGDCADNGTIYIPAPKEETQNGG